MSLMVRSLLILILTGILVSGAGAYIITIDAPNSIVKGSPLVITGNTTFPENSYFDLVLYYSKYTSGEVKRQRVIVDETKQFRIQFETRELEKGQYKVEVHGITHNGKDYVESSLGSSSVVRRIIQLIDRSDEIVFESSTNQSVANGLDITGRIKNSEGGVLTLRIFGPDGFTFGPEQLITTSGYADSDGHFSYHVPISDPGEYQVSLSDGDGYIGEYPFNLTDDRVKDEQPTQVITPTPRNTTPPSSPDTLAPRSEPSKQSPTRSALSPVLLIPAIAGGLYLLKKGRRE